MTDSDSPPPMDWRKIAEWIAEAHNPHPASIEFPGRFHDAIVAGALSGWSDWFRWTRTPR